MRQQEGGGYVCGHCGKTYTKEEAEQRQQALDRLEGLRRLQLIYGTQMRVRFAAREQGGLCIEIRMGQAPEKWTN